MPSQPGTEKVAHDNVTLRPGASSACPEGSDATSWATCTTIIHGRDSRKAVSLIAGRADPSPRIVAPTAVQRTHSPPNHCRVCRQSFNELRDKSRAPPGAERTMMARSLISSWVSSRRNRSSDAGILLPECFGGTPECRQCGAAEGRKVRGGSEGAQERGG
jgi:hypothetical protein